MELTPFGHLKPAPEHLEQERLEQVLQEQESPAPLLQERAPRARAPELRVLDSLELLPLVLVQLGGLAPERRQQRASPNLSLRRPRIAVTDIALTL